jgi:long-chain acyl-CoA synthetase
MNPTLPMLARRPDPASATWEEVTAVEFRDEVVDLAKGLIASGISPGHRVAIMARTRYEWTVLAYALWAVGAEIVPIYPPSSRDQVEWILRDSGCVAVVVEDEQGVMTVGTACASLPVLRHGWQLDAGALKDLVQRGKFLPFATVDSMRRIVMPDSTAVIIYTSGTTGRPRGCALSHRSLASPCDTLLAGWGHTAAPPGEQGSVLAFLPYSHVYGLMVQGMCVRGGLLMGHEPDLSEAALTSALRSLRPTYFYAVPSVFEKMYKNFLRTAQRAGRGALFERAAETARDFAAALERQRLGRGSGPGFDLRLQHALYERTVYRRLRDALGGRVRRAVSGGSPLHRDLSLFYEGIGIYVHDGYVDAPAREAREENALREEIGRAVAAANSTVSRSESIRVFRILPEPFDVAGGLLTPSMKLRRDEIVRTYAFEIDAMYQARSRPTRQSTSEELLSWDDSDNVFR